MHGEGKPEKLTLSSKHVVSAILVLGIKTRWLESYYFVVVIANGNIMFNGMREKG